MSVGNNEAFLEHISKELGEVMTISQVGIVINVVGKELTKWDILPINNISNPNNSYDCLERFLRAKSIEGKAQSTIKYYRSRITSCLDFINLPIEDIKTEHIRDWLEYKKKHDGNCENTIKGIRGIIHSFFTWIHADGLIPNNPTALLGTIKVPKKIRKSFTVTEIEQLRAECANTRQPLRNRALIEALLATGCRASELCNLRREQFNIETRELYVDGKGAKERIVYLDEMAVYHIKKYLDSRDDDSEYMFISRKTKSRLSEEALRGQLYRLADISGVAHCFPHKMRRTMTTRLIDNGMPIQEVSILLGHESISTTQGYIYTDRRRIKESYNRCS